MALVSLVLLVAIGEGIAMGLGSKECKVSRQGVHGNL